MRADDPEDAQQFDQQRKSQTLVGILLIFVGGVMVFVEPPGEHSHLMHQVVAYVVIAFGGMFVNKSVVLTFGEWLKDMVTFWRGGS